MTLSDILGAFLDQVDELDGLTLANAVRRLAVDCAALVGDHTCGEVAAICQRCGTAMIWIAAEQRDLENRVNRHGRQRALLDLIDLCEAVRRFHAGRGDDEHLDRMRGEISAALRPFVDAGDA